MEQESKFLSRALVPAAIVAVLICIGFLVRGMSWKSIFPSRPAPIVQTNKLDVRVEPAAQEYKLNLRESSNLMLRWNFSQEMASYIAEKSIDEHFAAGATEAKNLLAPEFVFEITAPGIVYWRMRGVNAQQQLTEWSRPLKVIAR